MRSLTFEEKRQREHRKPAALPDKGDLQRLRESLCEQIQIADANV